MDATNQSYSVKWFFVRYGEDSNRHIRFRIFPENEADMGELTARIYKWCDGLADSNVIFSWSKERYVPELFRYKGEAGLRHSEEIFRVDSEVILKFLSNHKRTPPRSRLSFSVAYLYSLFNNLMDDDETIRTILRELSNYVQGDIFKGTFSQIFRNTYSLLEEPSADDNDNLRVLKKGISKAEEVMGTFISTDCREFVQSLEKSELKDLLRSYIHMHCNRMYGFAPLVESRVTVLLHRLDEKRYNLKQ